MAADVHKDAGSVLAIAIGLASRQCAELFGRFFSGASGQLRCVYPVGFVTRFPNFRLSP